MSKLSELYITMESLRKLNLPIDERLQQEAAKLEEDMIRQEILPTLTDKIEPALAQVKRELVLVVDYIPGEPIKVSLSRRRNFTEMLKDAVEIKRDPQVAHRSFGPQSSPKDEIASKTILSVTMPDGRVIKYPKAKDTFIEVIKEIGVDKIRPLGLKFCKIPIISNTRDEKYGHAQHSIGGGWYVLTHSSTLDKKKTLDQLSRMLRISLKVDVLEPSGKEVLIPNRNGSKGKRVMYSLNGSAPLNKRNAVYATIKKFVEENPDSTFEDVEVFFPRILQGGYGVVASEEEYLHRKAKGQDVDNRYFIDKPFTDSNGRKFYVCHQWGDNFSAFRKHVAKSLSWNLEEVK